MKEKAYNTSHAILQSETAIANRLLARRAEMVEAYSELHAKLSARPDALWTLFRAVLSTAAFWNPDRVREARQGRRELTELNQSIAKTAHELAELLEHRDTLRNQSGFSSDTHYHVCEVIQAAAAGNGRFQSYVSTPLAALADRYDLKYWPLLSDFIRELASDADRAEAAPTDPLTAAATTGSRSSLADFVKALFAAFEENSGDKSPYLPKDLRLTDSTLASLINGALDLDDETMVDGAYVKRLRQRVRNTGAVT